MEKRIIVTSALPYANGSIHVGHLVEYIQTDIFVRFQKLIGKNAIYCCADDTHGAPISISAAKQGITPTQLISKYHKEHQEDFAKFHIKFDSYYSTNSDENKYFSDLIFSRLKKKGLIYEKEMELTYCENCKRFLPDRYVKGKCPKCGAEDQYGDVCEVCNSAYDTIDLVEPFCTICNSKPVRKKSTHFFFKLSALSDKLEKWLKDNDNLQPEVRNQILAWVKEGLKDWCISRDGPYFGFQIPGSDKYYYVWLDAPIGYISSFTHYLGGNVKEAETEWNKSEIIHVIGKDISYFHLLFWPAMLMEAGLTLPKNVVVHGFLTVNKEKMSKSRGTFLTAAEFTKMVNPEYLRYYYACNLSRKLSDIDLDLNDFKDRINNELVANVANLAYRTLSFASKNFDGKITKCSKKFDFDFDKVKESYEGFEFREATKQILAISSVGNKYFQDNQPWKLVKEDKEKAQHIISDCVNIIKDLCILIKPILPVFAEDLEKQLNLKDLGWKDLGKKVENHKLGKESILVQKIEEIEIKKDEPFEKIDLRVAKVLSVEDHPNAEKLYVLQIDLGEKRQLVAGLKAYMKKEELLGRHIVIVANLGHAKLRGVESQGMLLAAEKDGVVKILESKLKLGSQIAAEGIVPKPDKSLPFDKFAEIKFYVKDKKVFYQDKELKSVSVDIDDGAVVR